ncbi:MAG: DUF1361 domain-containing protein [Caldilineaceae bacterium]
MRTSFHPYHDKLPLLAILLLSSGLSIAMLSARVWYSGYTTYSFLIWNLFLAWIPLCSALGFWALPRSRTPGVGLLSFALFLCWLAFFPNAPYIVTDFLHLTERNNVPLWYDLLLIFSFAWNGLVLGFTSLWIVQVVIAQRWGQWLSWFIVLCTLAVSGFGIYLGRFLRWNSWDLLTNPQLLAADIVHLVSNPLAHPRTVVMTLLFSSFLMLAYLTLNLLGRARWQQS